MKKFIRSRPENRTLKGADKQWPLSISLQETAEAYSPRSFIILLALCFVVSFSGLAFAHPPSDIQITYDLSTKILKAVIRHNVSNPANHYIAKVDVGLNGKEIISQHISRQDNNTDQAVSYLIPDALPGDKISVEGYCSISGKLEKSIEVKS